MEVLEKYGNVRIIRRSDRILPIYAVEPKGFDETEGKILQNYDKLFTDVELDTVRKEPDVSLRRDVIQEYLNMKIPKTKNKDALIDSIINKVLGYGQLSDFIDDLELEEIMVNGVNIPVFVFHRRYGMCTTNVIFKDKATLTKIINRMLWIHNREPKLVVDLTTVDGSRVNITLDPIAIHGPTMTIRRQKRHFYTITELIQAGTLDIDLASLLWLAADGMRLNPANIMFAGSIGSGKTTLLNAIAMLTPPDDRIITIEETPELRLDGKENWIPLSVQEGYDMEALVRNTLRMRPDRIIVGEIRGSEAMALFNAMNVGHKGMGTIHSSSPRETIYRLESPPMEVPMRIVSNLDLIVIQNMFHYRGKPVRRITEVAEVGGHEKETILLGTIYQWDPKRDKAVESEDMAPTTFLDKLSQEIRVRKRAVVEELERRKMVLKSLIGNKVFSHEDVLTAINAFYRGEENFNGDVADEITKQPTSQNP